MMNHSEFIERLNNLKNEAEEAKDDYINCLEEQKKSKKIWAISKDKIKEYRNNYRQTKARGI